MTIINQEIKKKIQISWAAKFVPSVFHTCIIVLTFTSRQYEQCNKEINIFKNKIDYNLPCYV